MQSQSHLLYISLAPHNETRNFPSLFERESLREMGESRRVGILSHKKKEGAIFWEEEEDALSRFCARGEGLARRILANPFWGTECKLFGRDEYFWLYAMFPSFHTVFHI